MKSQFSKLALVVGLMAATVPLQAEAQQAVPLSPSLLDHHWTVIDFEGKQIEGEVPTFKLTEDRELVQGQTQCGTPWDADTKIDFPRIEITNVQTGAFECTSAPDVNRFLLALEKADRFNTSPDGLELLDKDGKRIALMVSGG